MNSGRPGRASVREDASFASTLANGLAVLEAFDVSSPLLGNSELAARTGLSRPTVARLSGTLARLGYLKYDPSVSKYTLWTGALRAAYPLLARQSIRQEARSGMQALADDLKAAVTLLVMDGTVGVIVEASRGAEIEEHYPEIGLSAPLIQIAVGRAMLTLLADTERERLLSDIAGKTPDLWQRFETTTRASIQACMDHGFCVSRGDLRGHVHSVGVPLMRAADGSCFGLSCGIAAFRLRPGQLEEEIGPRLLSLARSIRATPPRLQHTPQMR
jgi:DNA-binding IclR family transcriptional regulator